jgi:serine protease Do
MKLVKLMKVMKVMNVMKKSPMLAIVVGLGVLAVAVAPSVYGQKQPETRVRALSVLDGRGGRIGVSARDLDKPEADREKVQGGVVIDDVQPDSPAEKAGLKRADVIVEFDGEHVRSARQFSRLVQETAPGRAVKATIVRDGRRSDVQITPSDGRDADTSLGGADRLRGQLGDLGGLGDFNYFRDLGRDWGHLGDQLPFNFNFDVDVLGQMSPRGRLGVTVDELTNQLGTYFGAKEGVLVASVAEASAGDKAGLKAGDVITSVNGQHVRSRQDLAQALRDVKDDGEVTIGIVRDKKESSVKVKLEAPRTGRIYYRTRPA